MTPARKTLKRAAHLVENGYVDVRRAFDPDKLYVEVELVNKEHQSRAIIKGAHTNVILVERDHQRVGCERPGRRWKRISRRSRSAGR